MVEVVVSIFWGSQDPWTGVPGAQYSQNHEGRDSEPGLQAVPVPQPRHWTQGSAEPSKTQHTTRQGEK